MNDIKGNEQELVSIIIPVYQAEKYLMNCIASVKQQKYTKIEILLIDDGSTDSSLSICKKFAAEDPRVTLFHQENRGAASARNKGLDYAKGKYIIFLDSDDYLDKNAIVEMHGQMINTCADLCICGFSYKRLTGESKHVQCVNENCSYPINIFKSNFFWNLYDKTILFNIGTKLYRRDIIESNNIRFSENMIVYEDIKFCLNYLEYIERVSLCKYTFYHYNLLNINSVTHQYKEDFWMSTEKYCDLLIEKIDDSINLKRAICINLFRAFIQECYNPQIEKKDFQEKLKSNCFRYKQVIKNKSIEQLNLSLEQKVFYILIVKGQKEILWMLAKFVVVKSRWRKN